MITAKHLSRWLVAGSVLIIAVCLLLPRGTVPVSAEDKPARIEKWEYGVLKQISIANAEKIVAKPYVWMTTAGRIEADSMEELYKKIGGPGELPAGGIVVFYSALGSQGWEFVNKEEVVIGKDGYTFILFKRRI